MKAGTDAPVHRQPVVDVVCVGLATADTIVPMRSWPEPDGRLLVEPMVRGGGGPSATAAVTIARLGGSVAFVGAVGDDPIGARLLDGLREAGVRTALSEVRPGPTPESVILLDRSAGTRSILHSLGVGLGSLGADARAACDAARWVHVDHAGYQLLADGDRSKLSIDAGNPIPGLDLAGVGLYAPTAEALLARYPGRALPRAVRAALDDGAARVAVTCGEEGALAADASGAWRILGVAAEVVSTLGAGDVFHGALLASLITGKSLPEAVRRANVAAALSCRAIDGRSGIPTIGELEAALSTASPVEPINLEEDG